MIFLLGLVLGVVIGLVLAPAIQLVMARREWTAASREAELAERLLHRVMSEEDEPAEEDEPRPRERSAGTGWQ